MRKIYLDTETTGLDKNVNGIVSLAYVIEDGEDNVLTRNVIKCNTFLYAKEYHPKALEVNGETVDSIKSYGRPSDLVNEFIADIVKYSDGTKYKVIAYNGHFDTDFISVLTDKFFPFWFYKNLDFRVCDPFKLVSILHHEGLVMVKGGDKTLNLENLAEHFGIPHKAHTADSDVEATRLLYKKLIPILKSADWSRL